MLKLKKGNKDIVIKMLDKITHLNNLDYEMYDILPSREFNEDQTIFIEWYNCQNIVLGLMSNTSYEKLNDDFNAPANIGQKSKKPVGWYQSEFNESGRHMEGPADPDREGRTLSGYIPDRITDIIFHRTMPGSTKYKYLKRMLKDLRKIEKEFKK